MWFLYTKVKREYPLHTQKVSGNITGFKSHCRISASFVMRVALDDQGKAANGSPMLASLRFGPYVMRLESP